MADSRTAYSTVQLPSDSAELLGVCPAADNVCKSYLSDSESDAGTESQPARTRKPRVGLRGGGNRKYTLAEKLAARTIKGPSCWEVQGYPNPHNGYVQIRSGRHGSQNYETVFAHRIAWELANGRPVPDGLVVMHACDNPRCVNPAHLSVGTQKDNIRDAVRKGRWTVRRLSDDQVAEIRQLSAAGWMHKSIAQRFGVARNTITSIVTGVARTERIGEPTSPRKQTA